MKWNIKIPCYIALCLGQHVRMCIGDCFGGTLDYRLKRPLFLLIQTPSFADITIEESSPQFFIGPLGNRLHYFGFNAYNLKDDTWNC